MDANQGDVDSVTSKRGINISASVREGALASPRMFVILLMIASGLFAATIVMLCWVNASESDTRETLRESQRVMHEESERQQKEMRLMQLHFEEFNAILVRDGLVKPGDYLRGPTNPVAMPPQAASNAEGKK